MTPSPGPHRFGFGSAEFQATVAHGGCGEIRFHRARTGDSTTAFNFFDLSIVPPGTTIGRHSHATDNEETYVILSGRARMEVDGEEFTVSAGDVIVNRPGGTHALVNDGHEDVRLFVFELKAQP